MIDWDHLGTWVGTILAAILVPGGIGVAWINKRSKERGPLPRDEVEVASATKNSDMSTQIVTAALTNHVGALRDEFNERMDREKRERMAEYAAMQRKYGRLHDWAVDIVSRWDHHRQKERPPLLPD